MGNREQHPLTAPEAEAYVVGCLMVIGEKMGEARARLTPADFADKGLATIFQVLLDLNAASLPYSLPAAVEALKARGALEAVGGMKRLLDLCELAALPSHFTYYARIVVDTSLLRRLCAELNRMQADALEVRGWDHGQVCEFLMGAQAQVKALADSATASMATMSFQDAIEREAIRSREPQAVRHPVPRFGLADVDRLGEILRPGRVVVVGARPGVGKSTMLLHIALEAAAQGIPSTLVSLEMAEAEIVERIVARTSEQPRPQGGYSSEAMAYAASDPALALCRIKALPRVGIADLRTFAIDTVRREGTRILFVDYLQLVSARRAENRQQEVAAVARGLKDVALELDITVVAAAQLNRGLVDDEEPGLRHLRESGDIEASADAVLLLWRPSEDQSILCFTLPKHRGGATGRGRLNYRPATFQIRNATLLGEDLMAAESRRWR